MISLNYRKKKGNMSAAHPKKVERRKRQLHPLGEGKGKQVKGMMTSFGFDGRLLHGIPGGKEGQVILLRSCRE